MTDDGGAAPVDGRRARSLRTRRAIVDAVIGLVEAGENPTSRRVAERAGVGERTLFAHFGGLEDLHAEVAREMRRRYGLSTRPVDPAAPMGLRVHQVAQRLGAAFEAMTPLRRAVAGWESSSPDVEHGRAAWAGAAREELRAAFPDRLIGPAGSAADRALDVATAIASWAFWDEVRRGVGLDPREAAEALEHALSLVVLPGPGNP